MSAWAGLAGAASGVEQEWAHRREDIKEEAARSFKEKLEQARAANNQSNTRLQSELAAEKQGIQNTFASGESKKQRESAERIAKSRAGVAGGRQYLDPKTKALFDYHSDVMTSDSVSEAQKTESGEWMRQFSSAVGKEDNSADGMLAAMAKDREAKAGKDKLALADKAEAASLAKEDALANRSLGQKYPSQQKGLLDSVGDWWSGQKEEGKQSRAKMVMQAADSIEASLRAGRAVDPVQLTIMENGMYIEGIHPDAKERIEKLYAQARGYDK